MEALKLIRKWWHSLWGLDESILAGIDSHRWESKIEILAGNSYGRF